MNISESMQLFSQQHQIQQLNSLDQCLKSNHSTATIQNPFSFSSFSIIPDASSNLNSGAANSSVIQDQLNNNYDLTSLLQQNNTSSLPLQQQNNNNYYRNQYNSQFHSQHSQLQQQNQAYIDPQQQVDNEILESLITQKLTSQNSIPVLSDTLQKVQNSQFKAKQQILSESLNSQFKDMIEALYRQIEIQEWDSQQIIDQMTQSNHLILQEAYQSYENSQNQYNNNGIINNNNEEHGHALQLINAMNQNISQSQQSIETMMDEIFDKITNAIQYSVQSIASQVINDQTKELYLNDSGNQNGCIGNGFKNKSVELAYSSTKFSIVIGP
eukprot:403374185